MNIQEGETLIIPHVRTIGAAISYDGVTGVAHINTHGTYHVDWSLVVAKHTCDRPGDLLVALEDQGGMVQYALSGSPMDDPDRVRTSCENKDRRIHISGHTAVALQAGDTLRLVNRSGGAINLRTVTGSGGHVYSASLTITEIG